MSIFMLETIEASAQEWLSNKLPLQVASVPSRFNEATEPEEIRAVITRGLGRITPDLLDFFPNLQVVARCGVGLDNVDIEACKARKVKVMNAPGATTIAVAEQTFYLMLALVRNLNPLTEATRNGDWQSRNSYQGDDLYGKTLGLIGFGDIAQQVAQMGSAFGMNIQFWNHQKKQSPYPQVDLDSLFSSSDILSIHVALTPETKHIISARALEKCKQNSYLNNTARGPHVDQQAVLQALETGKLLGFAGDVFDPEPPHSDDPLLTHPRSLITPHISALTKSSYARMSLRTARNVHGFLQNTKFEADSIFA